jgi:hypothetical protein
VHEPTALDSVWQFGFSVMDRAHQRRFPRKQEEQHGGASPIRPPKMNCEAKVDIWTGLVALPEDAYRPGIVSVSFPRCAVNRKMQTLLLCVSALRRKSEAAESFYSLEAAGRVIKEFAASEKPTRIADQGFHGCSSLRSITLPDSVTAVGSHAFKECRSLESILLSESLKVIEEGAFLRCSALKTLVMPDAVTTVGESAFRECTSLVSATLSNSLTGLSRSMFQGCSSLRVVKPNERSRSRSGSSGKNKRSRSTGAVD